MNRKAFRVTVQNVVLVGWLVISASCGKQSGAAEANVAEAPPVTVQTQVLQPQQVVETTVLAAELQARRRATIAAEIPGVVEQVTVQLGDRVASGQLLATIDERNLSQAVAEAEALLRQARLQLERAQSLFERKAVTKANLLDATTAHDVAKARLASAQLTLEKAKVKAPWAGRIANRMVEPGSYVGPGTPLFDLVDDQTVIARALASEADVPYLRRGGEVKVELDVLGRTVEGRIARLGAALDRATRTLPVEVELDNRNGELVPGMVARMVVVRRRFDSAFVVPLEALVDLGDRRAVWVVAEDKAQLAPVSVVARTGESVVVSGLEAGTRVIVAGKHKVGPGSRVVEG